MSTTSFSVRLAETPSVPPLLRDSEDAVNTITKRMAQLVFDKYGTMLRNAPNIYAFQTCVTNYVIYSLHNDNGELSENELQALDVLDQNPSEEYLIEFTSTVAQRTLPLVQQLLQHSAT